MADSKTVAREVGMKVRQLRQERGWSLEKLALESNMNATFLGHVERGLRCPTVYTLQRICDGLGISLSELFLYSADPSNESLAHHVEQVMSTLTPDQARHVCIIVDNAVAMLK